MGNKVGLRVDSERNLFVEALVYEIKGKRVRFFAIIVYDLY